MCKYCESGMPTGGGIEEGDEANACAEQIAESLRDAIRTTRGCLRNKEQADEIDRCIDELVNRAGV